MLRSKVINGLIFAVGALVGSAATYVVLSKKFQDEKQSLIDSYELEFKEMSKSLGNDIPDETVEAENVDINAHPGNENYSGYFKPDHDAPINDVTFTKQYEHEDVKASLTSIAQATIDGKMGPVRITREDFEGGERRDLNRVSVLYYIDDDYICDADDETESRPDLFLDIGIDNLDLFKYTDAEVIWVMNQKAGCMYEVEVYHGHCPIYYNDD